MVSWRRTHTNSIRFGHVFSVHVDSGLQAQRDSVRSEWQKFLNLCICQETHLDNVEEFKRVNMSPPHTHTSVPTIFLSSATPVGLL